MHSSNKPRVLFFARDYQSSFFPQLTSDKYQSFYVTLNIKEKNNVISAGGEVIGCLEESYPNIDAANIEYPYLFHSVGSDRSIRAKTHYQRLEILRKEVSFWRSIYDQVRPNFIINEVVALEIAEVMFIEAKKRGIIYFAFGAFSVGKTFFWHVSPFHSSMKERLEAVVPTKSDLIAAEDYINKVNSGPIDNPFIKEYRVGRDIKRLEIILKQILRHSFLRIQKGKTIAQLCYQYSLRDHLVELKYYFNYLMMGFVYDKVENLSKDIDCIFFPMHFEPEATLFYMSTFYENQYATVENILKCMKESDMLLVKEHPAQSGVLAGFKWRRLRRRFPNLKLIKGGYSSKELIIRSKVTITLVSTAGFEAYVLGRNVIVLGKIYFDFFKGINYCSSYEELRDLLRGKEPFNKIVEKDKQLAQLIAVQNEGNPWPHEDLYSDKNISDIKKAIHGAILEGNQQR